MGSSRRPGLIRLCTPPCHVRDTMFPNSVLGSQTTRGGWRAAENGVAVLAPGCCLPTPNEPTPGKLLGVTPGPTSSLVLTPSLPCKTHPAVLGDLCPHPKLSGGFSQHTSFLQEALLVPLRHPPAEATTPRWMPWLPLLKSTAHSGPTPGGPTSWPVPAVWAPNHTGTWGPGAMGSGLP